MGKVDAFEIPGLVLFFNSNDHREPHFHAKRPGEWEIRAFINETAHDALVFEVKFGGDPPRRTRRELAALIDEHRVPLLEEWEQKVLER